ncbi:MULTISPECIES: CsbD family protein [Exiguobacterium]|uniref:CsbD family protein n=1 Tax=Exiguobacterium TaxID=33986 RepID=UPI001BE4EE25|nr:MULTISPECIES: CsbD family protein [Exiguobacterium]MCT4783031.1 CsbD family protein [Exiguobacterium himgiriensis]
MSKDGLGKKIEGALDKAAGKAKEGLGKATDDRSLKREGQKDQLKGTAKEKTGQAQQNLDSLKNDRR